MHVESEVGSQEIKLHALRCTRWVQMKTLNRMHTMGLGSDLISFPGFANNERTERHPRNTTYGHKKKGGGGTTQVEIAKENGSILVIFTAKKYYVEGALRPVYGAFSYIYLCSLGATISISFFSAPRAVFLWGRSSSDAAYVRVGKWGKMVGRPPVAFYCVSI